ncbi:hypothetical protein BaRGS_00009665 [Batillaria attramentaria]|uniref:Uncharacterized protein n=1 Tax=Batillaria attramentaria TaxID=370345 RepID=A0ABD0LI80_9CAEN
MKKGRVPMDPQPEEGKILVLRSTYTTLKADTSVLKYPDSMTSVHDVFVVEYCGNQPEESAPHAKCKKMSVPYIRTTAVAKGKLEDLSLSPVRSLELFTNSCCWMTQQTHQEICGRYSR